MKTVFVTVGSTSFDELIEEVCTAKVLHLLANEGFDKVVLQIGRGTLIPTQNNIIEVEWFRYKSSISEDIKKASLVIGHGGAGTILESLIEHKPLIAVLNDKLMDNHQSELAEQLSYEGYLLHCPCANLEKTLQQYFKSENLTPFISEPNMFTAFLEEFMGYR